MVEQDPRDIFERDRQLEQLKKEVERVPIRAGWKLRSVMNQTQKAMMYLFVVWGGFILLMLFASPLQLFEEAVPTYQTILRWGTAIGLGVPMVATLLLSGLEIVSTGIGQPSRVL